MNKQVKYEHTGTSLRDLHNLWNYCKTFIYSNKKIIVYMMNFCIEVVEMHNKADRLNTWTNYEWAWSYN